MRPCSPSRYQRTCSNSTMNRLQRPLKLGRRSTPMRFRQHMTGQKRRLLRSRQQTMRSRRQLPKDSTGQMPRVQSKLRPSSTIAAIHSITESTSTIQKASELLRITPIPMRGLVMVRMTSAQDVSTMSMTPVFSPPAHPPEVGAAATTSLRLHLASPEVAPTRSRPPLEGRPQVAARSPREGCWNRRVWRDWMIWIELTRRRKEQRMDKSGCAGRTTRTHQPDTVA